MRPMNPEPEEDLNGTFVTWSSGKRQSDSRLHAFVGKPRLPESGNPKNFLPRYVHQVSGNMQENLI